MTEDVVPYAAPDGPLSAKEARDLARLEARAKRSKPGFEAFIAVATEIHDRKLYRAYGTWAEYCREVLGYTDRHILRLIAGPEIGHEMSEKKLNMGSGVQPPLSPQPIDTTARTVPPTKHPAAPYPRPLSLGQKKRSLGSKLDDLRIEDEDETRIRFVPGCAVCHARKLGDLKHIIEAHGTQRPTFIREDLLDRLDDSGDDTRYDRDDEADWLRATTDETQYGLEAHG